MGIEFKKPLIIGDIDASVKSDISQIKQDIGDLSQLDTADKSSLVNALNEAIDSTLNGASRDLDNLSDEGNDKLRSLNAYANEGELLIDSDGLAFVEKYAHSTFDLSKFTVVGSPKITDDGIASGFSSTGSMSSSSFITCDARIDFTKKWEVSVKAHVGNSAGMQLLFFNNGVNNSCYISGYNDGNSASIYFRVVENSLDTPRLNVQINTDYIFKVGWDLTKYYIRAIKIDDGTSNEKSVSSTTPIYNGVGGIKAIGVRYINHGWIWSGSIDLKQFSITVDGVEVFSGNKTGMDNVISFNPSDTDHVIGSLTVTDNHIASGFSTSNYINVAPLNSSSNPVVEFSVTVTSAITDTTRFCGNAQAYGMFQIGATPSGKITYNNLGSGPNDTDIDMPINQKVYFKIAITNGVTNSFYYKTSKTAQYTLLGTTGITFVNQPLYLGRGFSASFTGTMDLDDVRISDDNGLIYLPVINIPYTESKAGSKIVDSIYRPRVNDMAEQFGYANYYTLDEDNGNFTLPQVELYGLIARQSDRPSNKYLSLSLGASGDTYVAPSNGYFMLNKASANIGEYAVLTNEANGLATINSAVTAGNNVRAWIPVKKNDVIKLQYTTTGVTNLFRFIYSEGSEGEA